MQQLEIYLDKYENGILQDKIFKKYKKFNYSSENLYHLHLNFLLRTAYNIKIIKTTRKRLNQKEFRIKILKKFNYQCIITEETCLDELTAAHIIPIIKNENYDINNGLLLRENLHKTFDNYKWSINPDTLQVEIKQNTNVGQIKEYINKQLYIDINNEIYQNLSIHYLNFIKNKNEI